MTAPARASRRQAERRGRVAEVVAALVLMAKGYRLVAHRARTPFGELDLVASKGRLLVVVEVKARADLATANEAVGSQQRRRIGQAASYWAGRMRLAERPIRFDLIAVAPWSWPRHVRGAWRDGD